MPVMMRIYRPHLSSGIHSLGSVIANKEEGDYPSFLDLRYIASYCY